MVALRQGIYTDVPLTLTREGVKRVDVDALYDSENYRPKVRQVAGTPMFLY
jgi:6-phosphofructokinase 1